MPQMPTGHKAVNKNAKGQKANNTPANKPAKGNVAGPQLPKDKGRGVLVQERSIPREVIYPRLHVRIMDSSITVESLEQEIANIKERIGLLKSRGEDSPIGLAMTVEQAKHLIGWETEKEYLAGGSPIVPRSKEDSELIKELKIGFEDDYLLKDQEGQKVRCWSNNRNRPFDERHALKMAYTILKRQWAGPLTLPGETINGETIIVDKTGNLDSGQHRLIGLILAGQIWAGKREGDHWQEIWPYEPVLETAIVLGTSGSPNVVRTLDNVKARTIYDVIYTSEIYDDIVERSERERASRYLGVALKFLWSRTDAAGKNTFTYYATHTELMEFLSNHPKILDATKHIFEENKNNPLARIDLQPGDCVGALYLMGCGGSDPDPYRSPDNAPRSEKHLDNWDNWERAKRFWRELVKANKDTGELQALWRLLRDLKAPEDGEQKVSNRKVEQMVAVAKAWSQYVQNYTVTNKDVELHYGEDADGERFLRDSDNFGGIDTGHKKKSKREEESEDNEGDNGYVPTPEEIAQQRQELRKRKTEEARLKLEAARAKKEKGPSMMKPPELNKEKKGAKK